MKVFLCALLVAAAPAAVSAYEGVGVVGATVVIQEFPVAAYGAPVIQTAPVVFGLGHGVVVQNVGHCGAVQSLGGVAVRSVRVAARAPRVVIQRVRPPTVRQRIVVRQSIRGW